MTYIGAEQHYEMLRRAGYVQFDVHVDGKYQCTVQVPLKIDDRSGDRQLNPLSYRNVAIARARHIMPVLEEVEADKMQFTHTYTVLPHDIKLTNNENKTSKKSSSSVQEPADK